MNIGIFDIGSNTIRMNVYAVSKSGAYDLLLTRKVQAGLASSVVDGRLSEAGIVRLRDALLDLKEWLRHVKTDRLSAFATAVLRNIANTQAVLSRIEQSVGLDIAVLSGETEAHLGFEGVRGHIRSLEGVLLDIGGGSTEITRFTSEGVTRCASYPVGSLNLYDEFVGDGILPKRKELKEMCRAVRERVSDAELVEFGPSDYVCAIGGSSRSVMKLANAFLARDERRSVFTRDEIVRLRDALAEGSSSARRLVLQTCPHRIHTILPGMTILCQLLKRFDAKVLEVCPVGIREGYLKRLLKESK